jgi:hypothetical protein
MLLSPIVLYLTMKAKTFNYKVKVGAKDRLSEAMK